MGQAQRCPVEFRTGSVRTPTCFCSENIVNNSVLARGHCRNFCTPPAVLPRILSRNRSKNRAECSRFFFQNSYQVSINFESIFARFVEGYPPRGPPGHPGGPGLNFSMNFDDLRVSFGGPWGTLGPTFPTPGVSGTAPEAQKARKKRCRAPKAGQAGIPDGFGAAPDLVCVAETH